MQHTDKELLINIKKSLVALLADAVNRHEQTRIELPLSIEQARWLGRKVQNLLEESEEEPLFADNPWNYEYDLPEEDRRLPSPHDWFDDDFVRRWKRGGEDEGRTKPFKEGVLDKAVYDALCEIEKKEEGAMALTNNNLEIINAITNNEIHSVRRAALASLTEDKSKKNE